MITTRIASPAQGLKSNSTNDIMSALMESGCISLDDRRSHTQTTIMHCDQHPSNIQSIRILDRRRKRVVKTWAQFPSYCCAHKIVHIADAATSPNMLKSTRQAVMHIGLSLMDANMHHDMKECLYDVIKSSIHAQHGFCDDDDTTARRNTLLATVGSGSKAALKRMLCDISANGSWETNGAIDVWVRPGTDVIEEAIKIKVASCLTEAFMSSQWKVFNPKKMAKGGTALCEVCLPLLCCNVLPRAWNELCARQKNRGRDAIRQDPDALPLEGDDGCGDVLGGAAGLGADGASLAAEFVGKNPKSRGIANDFLNPKGDDPMKPRGAAYVLRTIYTAVDGLHKHCFTVNGTAWRVKQEAAAARKLAAAGG
eukprot:9487411-Pyramimonas_sp.AAC.1